MARRSSSADDAGRNTRDHTEEATRYTSFWVERIARFGYSAKGVVYVVMGVLAVLAAVNAGGGSTTDQNGAFQTIEEAPFGQVLLGVVAVGLMGYVLWRSIQAVADPDGEGWSRRESSNGLATPEAPFSTRSSRLRPRTSRREREATGVVCRGVDRMVLVATSRMVAHRD